MKIKKFVAATVPDALQMVKAEFGPRAVILNTRPLGKDNRPGVGQVEVTAALDEGKSQGVAEPRHSPPQDSSSAIDSSLLQRVASDLRTVKERLRPVLDFTEEMPPLLMEAYVRLADAGFDEPAVKKIIHRLLVHHTWDAFEDRELIESKVREMLQAVVPPRRDVQRMGSGCQVMALVGPTGVGKTTTVAKLAAEAMHLKGQRVAAIAADDERVAALDQMRSYATIIGFSLDLAYTPEEMASAVRRRKQEGCDLILVDTTGANPCRPEEILKLREVLSGALPAEVHLVLSATTGVDTIADTLDAYRELPVDCLLFTKLDETRRPGAVLSALLRTSIPPSFIGMGRKVPGDLAVADPPVLVEALWR